MTHHNLSIICDIGKWSLKYGIVQNSIKSTTIKEYQFEANHDSKNYSWIDYFINDLSIKAEECQLFITDPFPKEIICTKNLLEILFETCNFNALASRMQSILTLYSQGLNTGLVLDSGRNGSYAIPVMDGYAFPHFMKYCEVGGDEITNYLISLLLKKGYFINRVKDFKFINELKEKYCYIAQDLLLHKKLVKETTCLLKSYTLPDGRVVRIDEECFMAPESLFNPKLIEKESESISNIIFNCIQEMDMGNRMSLYEKILLCGGTTNLIGLGSRLKNELKDIYKNKTLHGNLKGLDKFKVKIFDLEDRCNLAYYGASLLINTINNHKDFWVSKKEYLEDNFRALKKLGK